MRQSSQEEEERPGGKSGDKGECPWAGSAEREKEGGHQCGAGHQPGRLLAPHFPGCPFAALACKAAVPLFGGKPANQIGQQTGDLCGVGTARVSLTVYPAVFFKTEISARVTTAVNYWLWLQGLGGGGLLHSALLCISLEAAERMCPSPARVQVERVALDRS